MEEKKFDELLLEVEKIVKDLESGNSEAMKIIKVCSDKLNKATESVNKILDENGNLNNFEVSE